MKTFAVGHIDFDENELQIEIIRATDWMAALKQHSKLDWLEDSFTTLAEAKEFAFNCECMIDVVEIKETLNA